MLCMSYFVEGPSCGWLYLAYESISLQFVVLSSSMVYLIFLVFIRVFVLVGRVFLYLKSVFIATTTLWSKF